jgi:hypothetical protein
MVNNLSKRIEEAMSQPEKLGPTPQDLAKAIEYLHSAYDLLNSLPVAKPINPKDDVTVYSRILGKAIGRVWNACKFLGDQPEQKT